MGFIQDALEWLANVIKDALKSIISWIVEQIDAFTKWLRLVRHNFAKWLVKVMDSTWGFWTVIVSAVALAVGIVWIITTPFGIAIITFVKDILASIEKAVGWFLGSVGYNIWVVVHEIAQYLIPQYYKIWQPFYKAISNLSAELDYGFGAFSVLVMGINHIIANTIVMCGGEVADSWVIATGQLQEFFKDVDNNFKRYAYDPELIFIDIDRKIVQPWLQAEQKAVQSLTSTVGETKTFAESLQEYLRDVKATLENIIAAQDETLREELEKKFAYTLRQLDLFLVRYIDPIVTKLNGTEAILNAAIARNDEKIAALQKADETQSQKVEDLLTDGTRTNAILLGIIQDAIEALGAPGVGGTVRPENYLTYRGQSTDDVANAVTNRLRDVADIKESTFVMPTIPYPVSKNWFVGEY